MLLESRYCAEPDLNSLIYDAMDEKEIEARCNRACELIHHAIELLVEDGNSLSLKHASAKILYLLREIEILITLLMPVLPGQAVGEALIATMHTALSRMRVVLQQEAYEKHEAIMGLHHQVTDLITFVHEMMVTFPHVAREACTKNHIPLDGNKVNYRELYLGHRFGGRAA